MVIGNFFFEIIIIFFISFFLKIKLHFGYR